jgi:hypothetical protein
MSDAHPYVHSCPTFGAPCSHFTETVRTDCPHGCSEMKSR